MCFFLILKTDKNMITNEIANLIPPNNSNLLTPRQLEIVENLKLIGQGASSFYRDACRIMSMRPPFS